MLQEGRSTLSGCEFLGLIDKALPDLGPAAAACLDGTCPNAAAARRSAPACFVRLAPTADALFTARLLLDPTLPSVGVTHPPGSALERYWQGRVDHIVPPSSLWSTVATCAAVPPVRAAGRTLAVLTPDADLPLCRALARRGARLFGPDPLPLLSPRFDRALFVLTNQPASAPFLALLRRYGGAVVLLDACLLAAYPGDAVAIRLAEAELGRPVPHSELQQWRQGIARPVAHWRAEAAAGLPLFVHSGALAGLLPHAIRLPPATEHRVRAGATGLHAESCRWAAELLGSWGIDIRLDLTGDGGPASLTLLLAMRGARSLAAPPPRPPLIVTRAVADTVDLPPGTVVLPDQPSPPLLAEAIAAALPARSGAEIAADHLLAAL